MNMITTPVSQSKHHSASASSSDVAVLDTIFESYTELASLVEQRRASLAESSFTFESLRHLDWRIDSMLDGLRVTGATGYERLMTTLASPTPDLIFVATVLTLENRNTRFLKQLLALAQADAGLQPAVFDAFAWVPLEFSQPLIAHFMATTSNLCRLLGLDLYRQHQVPADSVLEWALSQPDRIVQKLALDTVGENGLLDLLPQCLSLLNSPDQNTAFAAARACLLLGEYQRSSTLLLQFAQRQSAWQREALTLLTAQLPVTNANQVLSSLGQQGLDARLMVRMAGQLGDPANIPALLRLMQNPALSRLAGQAFCTITGLDLVEQSLDGTAPEEIKTGPTDDPDDINVESDPDEALPWPDQAKLVQWWSSNGSRFKAGVRYLQGREINRAQCLQVLQQGCQGQRQLAAIHLKSLDPASPLFRVDAPVWRQQKRLAQLLAQG